MTFESYLFFLQKDVPAVLGTTALYALGALGIGGLAVKKNDLAAFALGLILIAVLNECFQLLRYPFAAAAVLMPFALFGVYRLFRFAMREKALFFTGTALTALFAGSALLIPDSWDGQVYQLELLARYQAAGSTAVLADNTYSAWPGLLQSFFTAGFVPGGINFPVLFNSLLTVILALSLCKMAVRYCPGKLVPAAAALAVLLSPAALILCRSLYAENAMALFFLAGFSVLHFRSPRWKEVLLAGIFAGAAAALKLTGAGTALGLGILLVCRRKNWRYVPLFIAGAVLIMPVFFFRVYQATGNPVYPFAAAWFGTSAVVENCHLQLGSYRYGLGPLYGTVFGWASTAFAGKLYDGVCNGFQQLVMLGCAVYFLHRSRGSRSFRYAGVLFSALSVMYLFWSLTSQQGRFLFPLLFLLALLAVFAAGRFSPAGRRTAAVLLILAALLTPGALMQAKHFFIAWRIAPHLRSSPGRFLEVRDPGFAASLKALGETPPKSRVLMLFEKRGLFMPRYHEIGDPGFQAVHFKQLPEDVAGLMQELAGFDYLFAGSGSSDVDMQENMIPVREKLYSLVEEAVRQGKLRQIPGTLLFKKMII